MSKHTPVKLHGKGWRQDHTNGGEFVPLLGSQGEWLADIRSNGDFHKFVVTALNAHDDLLAACKSANKHLADMAARGGPKPGIEGIEEWATVQQELFDAIAKAQSPAGEPR